MLANAGLMSFDPHMGVELSFKRFIFLRGGYKNLQRVPDDKGGKTWSVYPTIGAGFFFKNFQVDYALSNVGNFSQVLYSHVFSLRYTFKKLK